MLKYLRTDTKKVFAKASEQTVFPACSFSLVKNLIFQAYPSLIQIFRILYSHGKRKENRNKNTLCLCCKAPHRAHIPVRNCQNLYSESLIPHSRSSRTAVLLNISPAFLRGIACPEGLMISYKRSSCLLNKIL